jgi:2-dehydro-3-deoxyphosphooctonate aldolase (KDO 8-P synthase)
MKLENLKYTDSGNFFLLAGPCVIEGEYMAMDIAEKIVGITESLQIPYIFKGSYRKANRSRLDSFTGIGDEKALKILRKVADTYKIPVVIKKGQFLSPEAMKFAAQKVVDAGNNDVMITERGTSFGYQDLLVDYRGIPIMQKFGFPVILDATHSLQRPNQDSGVTGGMPELIETIARAGIAVGVDGLFMETHPEPCKAKSDGANMLPLDLLEGLLTRLVCIRQAVMSLGSKDK